MPQCVSSSTPVARRRRDRQRGVATVEFALILPLLLVLVLGTMTLAHAVITRFLMHSAAYDAARTCALARNYTQGCVMTVVNSKLKTTKTADWCNGGITPNVDNPLAGGGLEGVNVLQVQLQCQFIGGVGTGYLKKHGLTIATITARAAMPH